MEAPVLSRSTGYSSWGPGLAREMACTGLVGGVRGLGFSVPAKVSFEDSFEGSVSGGGRRVYGIVQCQSSAHALDWCCCSALFRHC